MVTAAIQSFTSSQQCGYLILQLVCFMWCEWAFSLVPPQIWRPSAFLYCYTASSINEIEDPPDKQDRVRTLLYRLDTQEHGGVMKNLLLHHISTLYHISIKSNPNVWYWCYMIDATTALHDRMWLQSLQVGVCEIVLTWIEQNDSRRGNFCFSSGWRST